MAYHHIEMIKTESLKLHWDSSVRRIPRNVPRNRFKRWWYWLKFRLVMRWTEDYMVDSVTIERKTVNTDRIVDAVMQQAGAIERIYRKECGYVIMGAKQAFGCERELDAYGPVGLSFRSPFMLNGMRTLLGLKVQVVPWFDGVLVMPPVKVVELKDLEGR